MEPDAIPILISCGGIIFVAGMYIGIWGRDRIWRSKGDHEYMNTIASGKHLYYVKRETEAKLTGVPTLDEQIRAKRKQIQEALDRGDIKTAHQLDREENALWARLRD